MLEKGEERVVEATLEPLPVVPLETWTDPGARGAHRRPARCRCAGASVTIERCSGKAALGRWWARPAPRRARPLRARARRQALGHRQAALGPGPARPCRRARGTPSDDGPAGDARLRVAGAPRAAASRPSYFHTVRAAVHARLSTASVYGLGRALTARTTRRRISARAYLTLGLQLSGLGQGGRSRPGACSNLVPFVALDVGGRLPRARRWPAGQPRRVRERLRELRAGAGRTRG